MRSGNPTIEIEIRDQTLLLETRPGLPGWRGLEKACELLIETMAIARADVVLELACGYGACGLVAAMLAPAGHVTLADDDALAIECVRVNIRHNQIENASAQLTADYDDLPSAAYDVALLHAPAYRGNAPVLGLIQVAHQALRPEGRLYLVGAKREGLGTFQRHTEGLFGSVVVVARKGGQRVLLAVKKERAEPAAQGGRAVPSEEAEFEVTLRGHHFHVRTRPGVFAHGKIDTASRLLLEVAEIRETDHILDLGCGYGLLGIVAARLAPQGHVILVDRNLLAVKLAHENVTRNGVDNAQVLLGDGVAPVGDRRFDLILCNPPFHAGRSADHTAGERLIHEGAKALKRGGRFYVVCNEFLPYERVMEEILGQVKEASRQSGFKVLLGTQRG